MEFLIKALGDPVEIETGQVSRNMILVSRTNGRECNCICQTTIHNNLHATCLLCDDRWELKSDAQSFLIKSVDGKKIEDWNVGDCLEEVWNTDPLAQGQ